MAGTLNDGGTLRPIGLTDQQVTARQIADTARTGGWLPTGWIDQTESRGGAWGAAFTPTGGTLYLFGGLVLPGGRAITNVNFLSAVAPVGPTHQFGCLVDTSLNLLATCVDQTTTAWTGNQTRSFVIATALGGSSPGTYTPSTTMEAYVGIVQTASTSVATLRSNGAGDAVAAAPKGLAPIIAASSNTGLTDPASLLTALSAGKVGSLTAITQMIYAGVS